MITPIESQIIMMNLDYGASLAWQAAVSRAMLLKANWLANRLNVNLAVLEKGPSVHIRFTRRYIIFVN